MSEYDKESDKFSDTSSQKARMYEAQKNCDAVYGTLEAWEKRMNVKKKVEVNTNKIMERMDLDRPILQREKFELIMLEKQIDKNGKELKQKEEIKTYQIKKQMADRMKNRKNQNKV